ncbi:hypothetical protein Tco_1579916, partial [Tanacetum coccineum]
TISAPRLPNPDVEDGEGSAQRKSTVIRLRIPPRRSTLLTPPTPMSTTPIPTATEVEDITLRDTIQLSIVEQKRTESEDSDEVDNSNLNSQNDPNTRIDPRSYKESLEVEKTADVQPVNVIEEEEESAADDYELRRRVKWKEVEETRNTPSPTTIRSPRIHYTLVSSDTKKLQELTVIDPTPSSSTPSSSSSKLFSIQHLLSLFKPKAGHFKRYKSFFNELQGRYDYLFGHLKTRFLARKKFNVLAQHLQVMEESLPKMVDDHVKELTKTQVPIYVAEGLIMERKHNQADVAKMIAYAIQQERENLRA